MLSKYPLSAFINIDPKSDEAERLVKDLQSVIAARLQLSPEHAEVYRKVDELKNAALNADPTTTEGQRLIQEFNAVLNAWDQMPSGEAEATKIVIELNAAGHNLQPIKVITRGFSYVEDFAENKRIRIIGVDGWVSVSFTEVTKPESKFLEKYSGESVDQLLALASEYRIDSIVLAFEEALQNKADTLGFDSLNEAELTILAIEALEREVDNGGYKQFFTNSSNTFAPIVVDALKRIKCNKTAQVTKSAIDAVIQDECSVAVLNKKMAIDDAVRDKKLEAMDNKYFKTNEDIANKLFLFIKTNRKQIDFR